ncbi:acetyl-CoA carboxylase biotin carboxylase subunit family protein [Pseudomonas sp. NPDC086251]|uniref:ATP-grasp domain-containing protein n=1 Tax=Pseudomonas sp. NPDC086251 TaxID=3364431 RepID=UPI003837AA50
MPSSQPVLLIIDYNLSRIGEVSQMREYAKSRWGALTWLIRSKPQPIDLTISDAVFNVDPSSERFVELAFDALGEDRHRVSAGLVFSDNAVANGAALLERLGLPVDNAILASAAFDKFVYRRYEARQRAVLEADGVLVPEFRLIRERDDLVQFAKNCPAGFVVKPTCEGNNRGVVVIREGDDLDAALLEVGPYLRSGVLAEQLIPYRREFSCDGVGGLSFITEKVSVAGRYPVEVAQVLPASLTAVERQTLLRTGAHVNQLIGQQHGPFHNEIKLSDDGTRAAVVEPNRRPGGMKIWSLAQHVHGLNLFEHWIDSVFGEALPATLPDPVCSAATVMLGVHQDIDFAPYDIPNDVRPLTRALWATANYFDLSCAELVAHDFTWLSLEARQIRQIPRDNNDFAAQVCIVLHSSRVDMRDVVTLLREQWLIVLKDSLERKTIMLGA